MSGHNIPFDLWLLIFERLPLKTLARFRSVCHEWNKLISSPCFVSHHLAITASDPSRHWILIASMHDEHNGIYSLFTSPRSTSHFQDIRSPFSRPELSILSILGVIHGVICLSLCDMATKTTTLVMWNPTICRFVIAPTFLAPIIREGNFMAGFGFNPIANDLKIVVLPISCNNCSTGPCTSTTAFVFSAHEGVWRAIGNNVLPCTKWSGEPNGCFLNGSIHWMRSKNSGRTTLLALDCETEKFWTIALPKRYARPNGINQFTAGKIVLQVFRGMLAVYEYDWHPVETCKITVMSEYGVVDSWSHFFTIQIGYCVGQILMAREEDGDEIIISLNNHLTLVAHDTITNIRWELGIRPEHRYTKFEAFAFEPSLMLMDVGGSKTYVRGDTIDV